MKKYFAFSMDADKKCKSLNDSDFRKVFCAVFNHLRDGTDPDFDDYLLYDFYERVLKTPTFYLKKIDGRSDTSAENGKKGGRPPKTSQPVSDYDGKIINCNGKAAENERVENAILEHIRNNPSKYKNGVTLPTIHNDMYYIDTSKEKIENGLDRLSDKGKIQVRQLNDYTFSITLLEAV